jgi:hypothetical protein
MRVRDNDRSQRMRRGLDGLLGVGGRYGRGVELMDVLRLVESGLGSGGGRGSLVRLGASRGRY